MNRYDGIDKRIVLKVRRTAKVLKRHEIFSSIDLEDLEQELMCEVFCSLDKFDERCGNLEHFVRRVLDCRGKNLIRSYGRKKRNLIVKPLEYCDEIHNEKTEEAFNSCQLAFERRREVSRFLNELPNKYRLLHKLYEHYRSVVKIAEITGFPILRINRDLHRIARLFYHFENSRNWFWLLVYQGEKRMSKNLSVLETLSAREISQFEVYDLADLSEQVAKLVSHTKELREKLDDALNLRFSGTVQRKLQSENRDTGSAKFFEDGFQICAEVPKKVTWDSEKIDEVIKHISEEKRKAIIKTTHVIDERKYMQLSPEDQRLFADARTVTPGKTKFKISIPEEL